jgi:hypothetical protein
MVVTFTDGITLAWLSDRDAAAARRVIEFAAASLAALTGPAPKPHKTPREPRPEPQALPTAPESSP